MGEPGRHRRNCERSRMGDPMETQGELWEIHGFGMGNRREIYLWEIRGDMGDIYRYMGEYDGGDRPWVIQR